MSCRPCSPPCIFSAANPIPRESSRTTYSILRPATNCHSERSKPTFFVFGLRREKSLCASFFFSVPSANSVVNPLLFRLSTLNFSSSPSSPLASPTPPPSSSPPPSTSNTPSLPSAHNRSTPPTPTTPPHSSDHLPDRQSASPH